MLQLPQDLASAIAQYLATRPFQEVFKLMNALSNLEPIDSNANVSNIKEVRESNQKD